MSSFDISTVNAERFWHEGYLMMRGLFSREEILELRERVTTSLRNRESTGTKQVDALADPLLAPYIYDKRLLDIARKLLGTDRVAYFGDSSYAVVGHGYQPGVDVGGWHRDNTDRSDTSLPDWTGHYDLIRFGLYLQDHRFTSGGLILRRTSHNRIVKGWTAHLADRYLNNGIGDISVWSMRIQHAGLGRCVRGMPWLGVGPYWQKALPEFLQAPFSAEERAGFWISYAKDGNHLQRHCTYLLGRKERLDMWLNSHYAPETLAACARAGLDVIDMPERLRQALSANEDVGRHLNHYQIAS